jgi:hypothetical protein
VDQHAAHGDLAPMQGSARLVQSFTHEQFMIAHHQLLYDSSFFHGSFMSPFMSSKRENIGKENGKGRINSLGSFIHQPLQNYNGKQTNIIFMSIYL